MQHPFEPFRIKMTESIQPTTREERERTVREARYNIFRVPSSRVLVDLLTDSGTGTMSQEQWSAMFLGDEAYANARSWERFEAAVHEFTGMAHVVPVHQGRAGEKIVAASLLHAGDLVAANTLFDTTRANIEFVGAKGIDLPCPEGRDIYADSPFKGNIDLQRLEELLGREKVRAVCLTVTNNTGGGQPVSLENARAAAALARKHGALFWLDSCRVAENAFFVRQREPGQAGRSYPDIIRDFFALADLTTFSAKKDGLVNMGGFVAVRDADLARKLKEFLILWEGFPTYGGLSGRDLDAIAQGLRDVVQDAYLAYRIGQTAYLGERLREIGFPVVWPPGGHAVYVEASEMLKRIPRAQFPAQSLVIEMYREGGVRSVEIGSLMFGAVAQHELVRFAIPRRAYTQSHMDHVVETARAVIARKDSLPGYRITYEPPHLRHFLAELEPIV